jgi:hypothetical protein
MVILNDPLFHMWNTDQASLSHRFLSSDDNDSVVWLYQNQTASMDGNYIDPGPISLASSDHQSSLSQCRTPYNSNRIHGALLSPSLYNVPLDLQHPPFYETTPAHLEDFDFSSLASTTVAEDFYSTSDQNTAGSAISFQWQGNNHNAFDYDPRTVTQQHDYGRDGWSSSPLHMPFPPPLIARAALANGGAQESEPINMFYGVETQVVPIDLGIWGLKSPNSGFVSADEPGNHIELPQLRWRKPTSFEAIGHSPSESLTLSQASSDTIAPVNFAKAKAKAKRRNRVEKAKTNDRQQRVTRRQRGLNKDAREKASKVRIIGSCIRCWMYHLPVSYRHGGMVLNNTADAMTSAMRTTYARGANSL